MTQFQQKLHRDLPPTTVWGYNGTYPGPTFEARTNKPIWVQWINQLPTTHFLPIDHTLYGAGLDVPDVRVVTHLHGGHVGPESDGNPMQWYVPGRSRTDYYPNIQPGALLWYHDHAIGITRLNVYAGLAGLYILRSKADFKLNLPCRPYEIPLVFQDRSFLSNGQLNYPSTGVTPYHPVWVPEFFGDTAVVNGKVWPYLEVEPRKYRFRMLNGCNARFLQLSLGSGQPFIQIGAEGGFLPRPAVLNQLLIAPGERADIILDFSNFAGQTFNLTNDAPAPYPGGGGQDLPLIMQFRVTLPLSRPDKSSIPPYLPQPHPMKPPIKTRNLLLTEVVDQNDNPIVILLDEKPFAAPPTEIVKVNTTEIWNFINLTPDTHPIHLHLTQFRVLNRQPFDVNTYKNTGQLVFTGQPIPPESNETGLKDVVKAYPGMVTRIQAPFTDFCGNYVWHCHILEHEDNEMMRPLVIVH
ncbi:multicopper oxidase family protein [Dictyobacter aurantiacus]|uniref:Spore coat protein A n=1 Tax=Dictyobacter aurantiacus TaxID=1936993 RepID=A0A401ZKE9_9CHLR|nr:multicopper oxidase [Dictyobacter aurantiacus]GCE07300.1 spore coat protein A [Dictyobacter aurantiacus]